MTGGHATHRNETPLRTQAKGGCEVPWLWGLGRDERGWNKEAEPAVYVEHDASRGGHVAERMPDGALIGGALIETLQIDGWTACNRIRRGPGQNDGGKIARGRPHARRKVSDSQKAAPSTLAKRGVKRLKAVHEVEERVHGCPPEARQALRRARSLPVLEKIRADLLRVEPGRGIAPRIFPLRGRKSGFIGLMHRLQTTRSGLQEPEPARG
ncbi:IS66 family transposase [Rhodobacter capsulatus]|uniref:IS66 family transposase n=1 Tax=Rhodobacter capsulatus TaxID=1061 RepID=UPI00146AB81E|nr:transposase [Rhodobacter capsulatus]